MNNAHPTAGLESAMAWRGIGNIGGDTRLDFTVVGPAVNLTSRIESMCKNLDRTPLLSAKFAHRSGVEAEYLGEFELKGVAGKRPIYGLME
jgi:adenylate cyclase